jgi:antitoxin VapB
VGLHVADPEADRLARQLAEHTGETVEQAVVQALRDRLAKQEEIARKLEALRGIQRRVAALPVLDHRTADEILGYDENGLPT